MYEIQRSVGHNETLNAKTQELGIIHKLVLKGKSYDWDK